MPLDAGLSEAGLKGQTSNNLFTTRIKLLELSHRYPLVLGASAWILGIFGCPWLIFSDQAPFLSGLAAALVVWGAGMLFARSRWLSWPLFFVGLTLLAAGYARARTWRQVDSLSQLASRQSQPIALKGIIIGAASWTPSSTSYDTDDSSSKWLTRWQVEWMAAREANQWQAVTGRSELRVPERLNHLFPGDVIQVFGSLQSISPPTNPGGIDYATHARRKGNSTLVKASDSGQITIVETIGWFWLNRFRALAVNQVDGLLHRYVSNGQAPLAAALVFGQREQVDWESHQAMMATGTLHMLSISGMHVEMIAGFILMVCLLLSVRPKWTMVAIIGICLLYAFLAGGRPPVLRAVTLVVAMAAGNFLGNKTRLFNLLGFAALILLIIDPTFIDNVGVHLSFIAVMAIGVFHLSSPFKKRRDALEVLLEKQSGRFRRWFSKFWVSTLAALQISFWVWIITCPLIWHHFHVVSPISIPLNVLIAPAMLVGLISGLITGVLGWLPPVGWMAGAVSGNSLELINRLVTFSSQLPLSHFWLPSPPFWWSILFYAMLLGWLALFGLQKQRTKLALLLLLWLSLGWGMQMPGPRGLLGWPVRTSSTDTDQLCCTFLDVGHGTCVLIELPDGRVWMYDAGRLGQSSRSSMLIAPALWHLPTSRIDLLLVSHADSDHYNAISGLLDRFHVERVASTRRFWASSASGVQHLRNKLEKKRIPMLQWDATTEIPASLMFRASVLHPGPNFRGESDNAESLCIELEYAGTKILLTGDIEGSGVMALCEQAARKCHVMMAPHHGSLSYDNRPLLDWCQPEVIVISGGERSVQPAVMRRYAIAELLGITFRDGATQIRINSEGNISVFRWNRRQWSPLDSSQRNE